MRHTIDRLREADPVRERDLDVASRDDLDRLWTQIDAAEVDEQRAARRAPRRRWRLPAAGLAGVAAVAAAAVAIAQLGGGDGVDPAAEAQAAIGARGGVFHVETVYQTRAGGRLSVPVRIETWVRGKRGRSVQYGPAGTAVAESVSAPGKTPTTKMYAPLPRGTGTRADDPASTDPRAELLQTLRAGRVRDRGTSTVAGRRVRTLEVTERRTATSATDTTRGTTIEVPAHTDRTVLRVDADSNLPVSVSRSRLVPSFASGGTGAIRREVETERYLRFERLSVRDGRRGLAPSPRYGR